jgi:hypothetical protein
VALKEWRPVLAGERCRVATCFAPAVRVLEHPRLDQRVTNLGLAGGHYGHWLFLSSGRGGDGFFPELGNPSLKLTLVCGGGHSRVTDTIPIL